MAVSLRLREIFNERLFRIPDYQRGYAWEEKQLVDFWEDLEDLPKGTSHYIGAIFIEKSEDIDTQDLWLTEGGYEKFDVVDGQQRLTTIIIFLNELLSSLGPDEGFSQISKDSHLKKYICKDALHGNLRSYIFNYMSVDQNHQHMTSKIFGDPKALRPTDYNAYARNLDFAKEFFARRVSSLGFEERELLFSKVTNQLIFDLRIVESDLDVQSVFETMNNRGKKLTILERLKNRLVYLCRYLGVPDADVKILRKKINSAWRIVYQELAKNPEEILEEDDFFLSHISLIKQPDESVFSYEAAEKKIFEVFSTRAERYHEEKVSFKQIEDYLVSLSECASIWFAIHNSPKNGTIKRILRLTTSRDVKILLLSIFRTESDTKVIEPILALLEVCLFRNRVPGMARYDERQLSTWARDIFSREKKVEEFKDFLLGIVDERVDNEAFIRGIENLFTYVRGPFGYHRWSILKYFLYCYDEELRVEFQEKYPRLDFDDFERNTIEHVVPQAWNNNWTQVFEEAKIGQSAEYDYHKVLINSLGNLTILTDGKNSSLGDEPWTVKQGRYRTGSYNEIEISRCRSWDLAEIHFRGLKLLSFLEKKVTGLTLNEQEKKRLLFIKQEIIDAVDRNGETET